MSAAAPTTPSTSPGLIGIRLRSATHSRMSCLALEKPTSQAQLGMSSKGALSLAEKVSSVHIPIDAEKMPSFSMDTLFILSDQDFPSQLPFYLFNLQSHLPPSTSKIYMIYLPQCYLFH